jgi:hypothetical protein
VDGPDCVLRKGPFVLDGSGFESCLTPVRLLPVCLSTGLPFRGHGIILPGCPVLLWSTLLRLSANLLRGFQAELDNADPLDEAEQYASGWGSLSVNPWQEGPLRTELNTNSRLGFQHSPFREVWRRAFKHAEAGFIEVCTLCRTSRRLTWAV